MLIIITEKEIAAVQFLNTGEGIAKTQEPVGGERVITTATKQSSVYRCYCGAKSAPDYDAKEKQKKIQKNANLKNVRREEPLCGENPTHCV
jgi:hypothetical protein